MNGAEQFLHAVRSSGMSPPASIKPEKFYRFPGIGKSNGNTAGWCKLFADGAGGIYGDWSSDFSESWQAERDRQMTPAEREAFRQHVEEARSHAERDQQAMRDNAADQATAIWNAAERADDSHAYLVRKGIKPYGARAYRGPLVIRDMPCDGCLIVSMRDPSDAIHSLQFISDGADKRFLSGGDYKGRYYTIGEPGDIDQREVDQGQVDQGQVDQGEVDQGQLPGSTSRGQAVVCVCEGFATGEAQAGAENAKAGAVEPENGGSTEQVERSPTVAQRLIALGENCDLFHDERKDAYAVTVHEGVRRTLRLRGKEFRRGLCGRLYTNTKRAANGEAIAAALNVLEAKAYFEGECLPLHNRFAYVDQAIWIDLCDSKWRAVKVTADGWEVIDQPPVLFRRYAHQAPLPIPQEGGTTDDLVELLDLRDENEQRLLIAWPVVAMIADIPRPVLALHGPQGSAKTTKARMLRSLLDPSHVECVDLGRDPAALAQTLDHNAIPLFDNLTRIQPWQADLLCRAVTGGGFSKRELYTDSEDVLLSFKRPMILTGINVPTAAPDLLDRCLLIELERVAPDHRRPERELWARFEKNRPKLFGALLDGLAAAMRAYPKTVHSELPRMADFAEWGASWAEGAGHGAASFNNALVVNLGRQIEAVADGDPVIAAVKSLLENRPQWKGTASELLKLLNEKQGVDRPEGWPKNAQALAAKLNILGATLADIGISYRRERGGDLKRTRSIDLRCVETIKTSSSASSPSKTSNDAAFGMDATHGANGESVQNASEKKTNPDTELDEVDNADGVLQTFTANLRPGEYEDSEPF